MRAQEFLQSELRSKDAALKIQLILWCRSNHINYTPSLLGDFNELATYIYDLTSKHSKRAKKEKLVDLENFLFNQAFNEGMRSLSLKLSLFNKFDKLLELANKKNLTLKDTKTALLNIFLAEDFLVTNNEYKAKKNNQPKTKHTFPMPLPKRSASESTQRKVYLYSVSEDIKRQLITFCIERSLHSMTLLKLFSCFMHVMTTSLHYTVSFIHNLQQECLDLTSA